MTALLWLAAAVAPGCPAALDAAARTLSPEDLAAAAPAVVARLADQGVPVHAISFEAEAMAAAAAADLPAAEAAERFRARLARHCALAAQRRPEAMARGDRLALERILARPEFGRARADSEAGRWLAELWRRLLELLGTEEAGRWASGGRTGFFAAVVLSLAATLAWALRRRRRRPGSVPGRLPSPAVPPADESQVLARRALERGLWLEALRQAFLGLLAALERAGRIPRGRTLTNRELAAHLAACAPGSPGAPSSDSPGRLAAAFADLSSRFDRAVYGDSPVAGEEAAAFLERARQLGSLAEGGA